MMTLNDYQDAARKTAQSHTLDHFAFGLVEEAGEVAGVMKRIHRGDADYVPQAIHAQMELAPFAKDKLIKELGDVLWYVAMVADLCEVRLEEVASINIAKLQDRKNRNTLIGSGDNR